MDNMYILCIHSRKLTWNLKMMVSNRNLLFQVSIFGCHVSFRECTCIFFKKICIISIHKRIHISTEDMSGIILSIGIDTITNPLTMRLLAFPGSQ